MNLDKGTKSIIHNIFFGREHQSLVFLAEELQSKIRNKSLDKSKQWTTVRDALLRDGRADGIKLFMDAIRDIAQTEHEEKKKSGKDNN